MLSSVSSSPAMPLVLRSEPCVSVLSSVVACLESAEKLEVNLYQDYGITRCMQLFLSDVQALEVGKQMVWGGGWIIPTGGHAVMHVLQRDEEDSYTLTTCNSGEGVQYHNSSARCFPKPMYNLNMAVRNIPRARIVGDFSWAHVLWGLRFNPLVSNCPEVVF